MPFYPGVYTSLLVKTPSDHLLKTCVKSIYHAFLSTLRCCNQKQPTPGFGTQPRLFLIRSPSISFHSSFLSLSFFSTREPPLRFASSGHWGVQDRRRTDIMFSISTYVEDEAAPMIHMGERVMVGRWHPWGSRQLLYLSYQLRI